MNDNRKDFIREVSRKLGIKPTAEELDLLAECTIVQKYRHKQIVVNQGEVCQYFYFIEKGFIRQYTVKDGQEITVNMGHEGFFVSCMSSFFDGTPSDIIIETIEPTVLYGISHADMHRLTELHPNISRFFFMLMVQTIKAMESGMFLMRMPKAHERYQKLMNVVPEIVRRSPLKHLASLLMMRSETLSRIRGQYSDEAVWSAYIERERKLAEERS